jgi:hypothetical protein
MDPAGRRKRPEISADVTLAKVEMFSLVRLAAIVVLLLTLTYVLRRRRRMR